MLHPPPAESCEKGLVASGFEAAVIGWGWGIWHRTTGRDVGQGSAASQVARSSRPAPCRNTAQRRHPNRAAATARAKVVIHSLIVLLLAK